LVYGKLLKFTRHAQQPLTTVIQHSMTSYTTYSRFDKMNNSPD